MSLVNQMLQDLQERNAAESKPLAGLRAVPARPAVVEPAHAKPSWIAAIAITVVAVGFSVWIYTGTGVGEKPDAVSMTGVESAARPAMPDPAMTARSATVVPLTAAEPPPGFSGLETNRLDYFLRTPPAANRRVARPDTPKRAAVRPRVLPNAAQRSADLPGDASANVIKTPVSGTARLRREGLAALRAGRPIEAEQQFAKLVVADSENSESHLFLYAALMAQSRTGAARTALLAGLQRTTEPVRIAQVLANQLLADGRIDHALDVLNKYRRADRADLEYEATLAAVNQRAGNHPIAAEIYQQLLARQPGNGTWWVGLAISQEADGFADDAAKSFAHAMAAGTLDVTLARYAAERLDSLETGS